MTAEKYQNRYRIPSPRAYWHSYNGGIYFVTVCTHKMQHYFGEISHSKMYLSPIGRVLDKNIQAIPKHHPYAEIPLYVVMPNHIHLIVIINGELSKKPDRDVACRVSNNPKNKTMQDIANQCGKLSTVIGSLKSATTQYANTHDISFKWQTRFYDRVIRNNNELNKIADYIENNIIKWEYDKYHDNNKLHHFN